MRKYMMTAKDIMRDLEVSRTKAYEVLKDLNLSLEQEGFKSIRGKVPRAYFETKFYGYSQHEM